MAKDENCVNVKKENTLLIKGKEFLFKKRQVNTECPVSMCNGLIFFQHIVKWYNIIH